MKRTYNHLFLTMALCLCSLFTFAQADCSTVAVATGSGYSICAGDMVPAGEGIIFGTMGECPAGGGQTETAASDAVVAITDAAGTFDGCSTVAITAAGPLSSVVIDVDIAHTWVGDLTAELTSPSGTTITLFERIGNPAGFFGCAGNDLALVFDDAAAMTAADLEATCGNAPAAAGAFQSVDLLSTFAGEEASGVWTLCVADSAGGDTGDITGFGVTVTTAGGVPTPANAVLLDAAGNVVSTTSPFNPLAAGFTESTTFFAASACPDCNSALTPLEFIIEGGIALACKSNLNVSLDGDCSALITPSIYLVGADFDDASYEVTVTDADGNLVEDALLTGKGEYTVSVEHLCSGNSCWGTLTAEDKLAPTLECAPLRTVACYEDPRPSFPNDYPTAFDNCGISPSPETITYTESTVIPAGTILAEGLNGFFAPANWNLIGNGGATSVLSGNTITLTTFDFGTQDAQAIVAAPITGEVCLDYDFVTNDPGFDVFLTATLLTPTGQMNFVVEGNTNTGSVCVPIVAGELLAFAVFADGIGNPAFPDAAEAVISNIVYTNTSELNETDPCSPLQTVAYTFTAVDDCGNVSEPCTSFVLIERPSIDDIVFPGDIELECTSADSADPADLENISTLADADIYPSVDDQIFEIGTKICNYAVTFTDSNPIETCGNSFKIIRTWSIVDWCGDEVRTDVQIIKFTDNIAPTITCPASVEVPANFTSCDATIQIQEPEYVEACSSPVTFEITLPDGSAGFVGQNVTVTQGEDFVITFTATDACGNVSDACTQSYTVIDETGPVAICDQFTVASLGTDGNAHVCATTVDDGSYDNCEDDLVIRVKRSDSPNNVPFTECVDFDCSDLATNPNFVRFRVYDIVGNFSENDPNARYSECWVEVEVQDKIDPVITCPPNKIVDCMASTDVEAQGMATGFDNCDDVNIISNDNANIDDCGEGTIFRRWTIEGTSINCTQRITIERGDSQFFTGNSVMGDDDDIIFPGNLNLTCDSNNSDGSQTDPTEEAAGIPVLVGTDDDCANLFVGHEDQILFDDPEACFKIVRTWKVIDWCQFDPNDANSAGVWQSIQIINVFDNTAPEITACEDVNLDDDDGSCSEEYTLTVSAQDNCSSLSYDYQVDLDSDGTIDFSGSGLNDSFDFDLGTHTVYWTVTDDCGNEADCSYEIKVSDTKKPTPVCIVSLSTVVMPSAGEITIWDVDFESGSSFDQCSNPIEFALNSIGDGSGLLTSPPTDNQGNLIHSATFTCDQLGEQLVQLWVVDAAGNFDYCVSSIFIQNTGACDDTPQANVANVSGVIETEMQEEVEDVMVDISGGAGNPFMTSNSGLYEFLNLPVNNNYVLTPEKDVNPLNGVSTFDLVLISQHILGAQLLDSPYKIIAADANNSGSVTTLDLVNIRRVILNIDAEFTNNTSWRFVDMDFVFPNPANPFQTTFPEIISLNNFSNDEMAADFVGVKIGDVNDSATPNNLLGAATRNINGTLALNVNDAKVAAGNEFTVDFTAEDFNNILGYQFTMNFDQNAVEFVNVEAGKLNVNDSNFGLSMTENGVITTSWNDASAITAKDGDVLFSMTFKAIANVQLSNVLSATSNVTRAEAYTSDADLLDVVIEFNTENGTVVAGGAFELFQNTPNPVKETTLISFNLPAAANATLTIMDVSGRTLKVLNSDFAQGYNEVTIDRNELSGTGVLYYQLDTPTDTASKKMILVD